MLIKNRPLNNTSDLIENTYTKGYIVDVFETLSQASMVAKNKKRVQRREKTAPYGKEK